MPPVPWKPGYKTTEFAIVVLTNVGLILAGAADWLPPRYAAIGSAISSGAFAISRGLAKIYPAPVAPVAPVVPVQNPPVPPAQ